MTGKAQNPRIDAGILVLRKKLLTDAINLITVKLKLKGHQKRVTGLTFSTNLNILVSSGADAQLCFWNIDSWEKRKSVIVQLPVGKTPNGDTRVQFHADQVRLLVAHETQLAIYDASTMDCIRQGVPQDALSAYFLCSLLVQQSISFRFLLRWQHWSVRCGSSVIKMSCCPFGISIQWSVKWVSISTTL